MNLKCEDAEDFPLANLEDGSRRGFVFEPARHIRRRVQLNLAQRRSCVDVPGIEPRDLRIGQGDIDRHSSLHDVILGGVRRRELGLQRLSVAGLEQRSQCGVVLKHARHVRPRTQLHLAKCCAVNDSVRLCPCQHRVVRHTRHQNRH